MRVEVSDASTARGFLRAEESGRDRGAWRSARGNVLI
jgi:hypothetical protein